MRIAPKYQTRRVRGPDAGGWAALPPLAMRRGQIGRLLATRASLTAALHQHGKATVTVLRQRLARPNRDEAGLLAGRRGQKLMVREVLLHVDGRPWVFAHTLANRSAGLLLRRAGRRPLATVLFTDPRVHAGGLHYRNLPGEHALTARAAAALSAETSAVSPGLTLVFRQRLPARRAVFIRGSARLVVTEVFLPLALGDSLTA